MRKVEEYEDDEDEKEEKEEEKGCRREARGRYQALFMGGPTPIPHSKGQTDRLSLSEGSPSSLSSGSSSSSSSLAWSTSFISVHMRAMDGVMSEVQEEEPGTSHYLPTPPTSPRPSFFCLIFLKYIFCL